MRSHVLATIKRHRRALTLVPLVLLACDDPADPLVPEPPIPEPPAVQTGGLRVTVQLLVTDGASGTFDIVVERQGRWRAHGDAPLVLEDLPVGAHTITVEPETGCVLLGGPQTAIVYRGRITDVRFTASCITPGTGIVRVGVFAPLGTVIARIDNGPAKRAAAGQYIEFVKVPSGPRRLDIDFDPPRCTVDGVPDTIDVIAQVVTSFDYWVSCEASSVVVTVTTTGGAPDPDGYLVHIREADDSYCYDFTCRSAQAEPNDTVRFDHLRPFPHLVELDDVASNCRAVQRSYEATPVADGSTVVAFQVFCEGGSILVSATTSGVSLAPSGYTVHVAAWGENCDAWGGQVHPSCRWLDLGANGTLRIDDLMLLPHVVVLQGVPWDCMAKPPVHSHVTPEEDEAREVHFEIGCGTASLVVEVSTRGENVDPDGYLVSVRDASDPYCYGSTCEDRFVAVNDTVRIDALPPSQHLVRVSDVASNCRTVGGTYQHAPLTPNESTTVRFELVCE